MFVEQENAFLKERERAESQVAEQQDAVAEMEVEIGRLREAVGLIGHQMGLMGKQARENMDVVEREAGDSVVEGLPKMSTFGRKGQGDDRDERETEPDKLDSPSKLRRERERAKRDREVHAVPRIVGLRGAVAYQYWTHHCARAVGAEARTLYTLHSSCVLGFCSGLKIHFQRCIVMCFLSLLAQVGGI